MYNILNHYSGKISCTHLFANSKYVCHCIFSEFRSEYCGDASVSNSQKVHIEGFSTAATRCHDYNMQSQIVPQVGTKCDLRSDVRLMLQLARYGQAPITTIQGHQLAQRLGAVNYVETSALTQHDLKEAFDQAIVSALNTRRGGASLLYRRRKPPPLWRRWLCCWERSSSSET